MVIPFGNFLQNYVKLLDLRCGLTIKVIKLLQIVKKYSC